MNWDWERGMVLLRDCVPQLFAPGTLLYVGASRERWHYAEELRSAGRRMTLVEIWHYNVDYHCTRHDLWDFVVIDDITRYVDTELQLRTNPGATLPGYDAAIWWHGPEHVDARALPGTLSGLKKLAPLVVLGCPWGNYVQAEIDGNPYEAHRQAIYPNDLINCGFRTRTVGRPDHPLGQVLAWWEAGQ